MTRVTITEALAEIKTIAKRIEKKEIFVRQFLLRQEAFKDPLALEGGSPKAIAEAMQSIADLRRRHVAIRSAITAANMRIRVTLGAGSTVRSQTITEWLTWRREVAPGEVAFVKSLQQGIATVRSQAMAKGVRVSAGEAEKPTDVVVNLDEGALARGAEDLEAVLGELDGQLSLKNATEFVEY